MVGYVRGFRLGGYRVRHGFVPGVAKDSNGYAARAGFIFTVADAGRLYLAIRSNAVGL